jgi:hypothetical protein
MPKATILTARKVGVDINQIGLIIAVVHLFQCLPLRLRDRRVNRSSGSLTCVLKLGHHHFRLFNAEACSDGGDRCELGRQCEYFWLDFTKGNEPPSPLVPKNQAHTTEALEQRKSPDGSELRVIAQHFWQPVIRDAAAKVVNVVHADIAGEPA